MASLSQIFDWFMTGKKPTQAQFWATWGSFWNKEETIPQSAISNLASALNAKAEKSQFDSHKSDPNAHAELLAALKTTGRFLINRNNLMFFADEPLQGDTVTGTVEDQYLNAGTFYGGDPLMLASYKNTEIESVGEIVSFDSENYLTYILRDEIFTRENAAFLSNVTLNVSPPSGLSFDVQIYPGQGTELINPMASYVFSEIAIPIGSVLILKDNLGEFADSELFTVNLLDTIKENIFDIKRLVDGELFIYPKRRFNPQGNYYMVQKDGQGIDVASRFFNEQYSLNGISSDLESGELIWQLQMFPPFYGYYVIIDTDTGKEISNKYTIPQ